MSKARQARPSPSMVVALIALFVALTGSAIAVDRAGKGKKWVPANSVGPKQLKTNAVTAPDIAPDAVTAPAIAPQAVNAGKIQPGSITAQGLAPKSVDSSILAPDSVQHTHIVSEAITAAKFNRSLPRVSVSLATPLVVDTALPGAPGVFVESSTPNYSNEQYDTESMHPTAGVTAELKHLYASQHGLYTATLNARWRNDAGTARGITLHHAKASCGFCTDVVGQSIGPPASAGETAQSVTVTLEMKQGDYVYPSFASRGSASQVDTSGFTLEWIGPEPD